jgi:hypothetical protein
VITPTCQECGTAIKLEDGTSVETIFRRGRRNDEDEDEFSEWNQELRYRFCSEPHLSSWLGTLTLPPYEVRGKVTNPLVEVVAISLFVCLGLVALAGALFGFVLLIERIA